MAKATSSSIHNSWTAELRNPSAASSREFFRRMQLRSVQVVPTDTPKPAAWPPIEVDPMQVSLLATSGAA